MSQTIDAVRTASHRPASGRLPFLPHWVVPRERLARRLDRGVSGLVTLVTGAPGWGKTLGVASWARDTQTTDDVLWVSAAGASADPDAFWGLLREQLVEEGARHLTPVPPVGAHDSRRTLALATLGSSLGRSRRRVLVLDDYPTGEVGALGRDLGVVLDHSRRGLSLIVISRGEPAFAVHRHHVAGDLRRITVSDLAMDWREVAGVLVGHDAEAEELTARTVERHTDGWAVGVRLTAMALRDTCSVEAALEEADRATVEFLTAEVLRKAPSALRNLILRTSMVEEVDRGLARSVGGPTAQTVMMTPAIASEAFVELRDDLSFRCPPLLRAAAAAELAQEPLEVRREVHRRAAQWHVDHGQPATGLDIATAAEDWAWVGQALVQSHVVPQILVGGVTETVGSALAIPAVRAAEPLIEAAMLLRSRGPDAAESKLDTLVESRLPTWAAVTRELSAICVRLAVARARGDADSGLLLVDRARELLLQLREGQPELVAFVAAHEGALAVCDGQFTRAVAVLRRGVGKASGAGRRPSAVLDCQGQLALLDAFEGNLRAAELQAAAVIRAAGETGSASTAHAHLAAAWVHVERVEHALARQHLDRSASMSDAAEPWYHSAHLLAECRMLVATDQPEAALRLLHPEVETLTAEGQTGWRLAFLTLATADALVATGEPLSALQLVVPGPPSTPVTNGVLAARALVDLGDVPGARKALAAVSSDLIGAPLDVEVEHWLLKARLADQAGASTQAQLLVGRVLRVSAREQLRRPLARESTWLVPLVERDVTLRRKYGGFLGRLTTTFADRSVRVAEQAGPSPVIIEALTVRETQVLGLLAEMCSTEEIAGELYLSGNTVKTHVRGILRKLAVSRRVDAVRRGREVGLC